MLFSNKDDQDGKKENKKKGSTFGLLFNPNRDTEIDAVKDSFRMFPKLIAMVFAMAGLFPKDHPALTDEKLRLSLRSVFGTAWQNVHFTREGLPGATIFMAVVSMLAFTFLFFISLIMSLMTGTAHAAGTEAPSGSMFVTPASEDWAISWIDYLFKGIVPPQTGSSGTDCALQEAMSSALSFFSGAVLVFAGIMLLYHLTAMIAKTAQSGKPFEGANQVWAPIRLVFAIALLVPLASSASSGCSISGYNTGQYLVMKVAEWGSGLGSNAWKLFVNSLVDTSDVCAAGETGPSCVPDTVSLDRIIQPLILYDACAKIANHYFEELYPSGLPVIEGVVDITGSSIIDVITGSSMDMTSPGKKYFAYKMLGFEGVGSFYAYLMGGATTTEDSATYCGAYVIPEAPTGDYADIYTEKLKVYDSYRSKISALNDKYLDLSYEGVNATDYDARRAALGQEYETLVSDLQSELTSVVSNGLISAKAKADESIKESLNDENFTKYGWLTAGVWFNTIARSQAEKFQAITNSDPTPLPPNMTFFMQDEDKDVAINDHVKSTRTAVLNYQRLLNTQKEIVLQQNPDSVLAEEGIEPPSKMTVLSALKQSNPIEAIFYLIDAAGGAAGIWDSVGTMAVQFGFSQNPIEEMAAFGHKNLTLGGWILSLAVFAGFLPLGGVPMAAFISTIAYFFYMSGFMLAFVIPLYPFYRFFFGSLKWIMSVFEGVILMPLFALAHIHPGGDGLAGPQGKYGYTVLMQILLRPILMVFGLVAGFLLFKMTLIFLNEVFETVSHGTGAFLGGNAMLAKFVYSMMYAGFALMLANTCFKPIGLFPQVALSWLGIGKPHEEGLADTEKPSAAAMYIAHQTTGKMGAVTGIGQKALGYKTSRASEKGAARNRKNDLLAQGYEEDANGTLIDRSTGLPVA